MLKNNVRRDAFYQIIIFLGICFSIFSTGCEKSVTAPEKFTVVKPDTLIRKVTDGVTLSISGLKDSYSIDEYLKAAITIENSGDSAAFKVNSRFRPNYNIKFIPLDGGPTTEGPFFFASEQYIYELKKGEKKTIMIGQSDPTGLNNDVFFTHPGYSGSYLVEIELLGNTSFAKNKLYKYITVREEGEPIEITPNYLIKEDSLHINFMATNRYASAQKYDFEGEAAAKLSFYGYYDNKFYFTDIVRFNSSSILLNGHAESLLLTYSINKKDKKYSSIKGVVRIIMELNFKQKKIQATAFCQLDN